MNPPVVPHSQRTLGFCCNGFGGNVWLWEVLVHVFHFIRASGNKAREPSTMRQHVHFCNGFRAGCRRREVLVKRMDVLCQHLVACASVFADAQAKLVLFTAICGFFWAVHGGHMPHAKTALQRAAQMVFGLLVMTVGKCYAR